MRRMMAISSTWLALGVLLPAVALAGQISFTEPPENTATQRVIKHSVARKRNHKLGSFVYVGHKIAIVHIYTTPAKDHHLIPPSGPVAGTYSSETIYKSFKDTGKASWRYVPAIPGKRVNVVIKGHYGWLAKGGGNGGTTTT